MNFQKTANKWQLIVSRRNCMLRINLVLNGASHALNNEIDFDNNQVLALSYDDERGVYNDEESLRKMGMVIVKAIKENPDFIEDNVKRCIEVSEKLVKVARESSLRKDLIEAFKEYVEEHHKFSAFMFFPIGIEKIITKQVREEIQKLVSKEKFQDTINKLTTPSKILDSTQEQIDLMKIALEKYFDTLRNFEGKCNSKFLVCKNYFNFSQEILCKLKEHQDKYGFLNIYNQDEKQDSVESYKTRLHALLETDVKQKLENFQEEFENREKEFEDTVKRLNISGHLLELVKVLREYVYLRSYRLEMLNKSNLLIQPLLERIGKKFGLSLKEVCALTAEEIIEGLEKNNITTSKEIKSRVKGYIYLQQGKKYQIFTNDLDKIREREFGKEKDYSKITKFKGTIGFQGKIVGKVRVIQRKEDIHKLKQGEVLVTSMTTPDHVMAMEKSAAIVTDEGGMLCHAAIVSREMEIPCVIGTEIATKVLKTGDTVEVDATKGTITLINN